MTNDEMQALISGQFVPSSEFERVCFDYAAASADPTQVPGELLDRLAKHLSPAQIVELACVAAFWKFYNTVHDSQHIPVEAALLPDTSHVKLV
jgi:hypothetical protein